MLCQCDFLLETKFIILMKLHIVLVQKYFIIYAHIYSVTQLLGIIIYNKNTNFIIRQINYRHRAK